MNVNIELSDEMFLKSLQECIINIEWSINATLKSIIDNGEVRDFQLEDLRSNFETFEALNKIIPYFGGNRFEIEVVDVKNTTIHSRLKELFDDGVEEDKQELIDRNISLEKEVSRLMQENELLNSTIDTLKSRYNQALHQPGFIPEELKERF